MALPRVSPRAYRRITGIALLSLAFIVVTGAAVRLTDSGLGCTDWPTCEDGRLTPVDARDMHAMVEFVNRTITGVVSVAVAVAVLGSLRRTPHRRDLVWLSAGLVAGVLAQIVLGGLTVLFELAPPLVMGHFLLSMVLLADAVVLHHRAGRTDLDDDRLEPVAGTRRTHRGTRRLLGSLLVVAGVVLVSGTVVTATGPHAGDPDVPRLALALPEVARVHGGAVVALLVLTLASLRSLRRTRAPASVQLAGWVLLAVLVAQGAVGYVQYFTGVPELLVGIHVAGSVAVWWAVLRLNLVAADPVAVPLVERAAAGPTEAALARA